MKLYSVFCRGAKDKWDRNELVVDEDEYNAEMQARDIVTELDGVFVSFTATEVTVDGWDIIVTKR